MPNLPGWHRAPLRLPTRHWPLGVERRMCPLSFNVGLRKDLLKTHAPREFLNEMVVARCEGREAFGSKERWKRVGGAAPALRARKQLSQATW